MPPPSVFNFARIELARTHVSPERTLKRALVDVAVIASEALGVERISMWRFMDDRQAIRCQCLFQQGRVGASDGAILRRRDFPGYFEALQSSRVVRLRDVREDPVAAEFREPYFEPLGITAMLDAPVYQDGVMTAVVCHEHLGTARDWSAEEAEFAGAVADTVARLYGEARLRLVRDEVGAYRRQVDQLGPLGALGRLAARMAHDFGAVLQSAQARAEQIARRQDVPSEVRDGATAMLRDMDEGQGLVRVLLELGRAEPSHPRVVDVPTALRKAEPLLRLAAGDSTTLIVQPGAHLSPVLIDPVEFERALVNLVVNARDSMPGGGTITCRATESVPSSVVDASLHVSIEVADQGAGLTAEAAAHVFEPYFTLKGTTAGLGLSIVQQTIVMAGGFVEAVSPPGHGTTVRLFLPAIGVPVA